MSDSPSQTSIFTQLSPVVRHYAYGADSYQSALRCIAPVLVPSGTIEGLPAIGYFTPPPGSFRNIDRLAKARDSATVLKIILKGCKEDGLTFLADGSYRQPGYETLALFYSETNPPTFARAQGANWIVKQQLDVERSFNSPAAVAEFLNQDLFTYLLAPTGSQPLSYSQLKMNPFTVSANGNGKTAHLFEVEKPGAFDWSVVPPQWLKLDTEKQVASVYDSETFEPFLIDLPIPAWRRPAPVRPLPPSPPPRALAPEPFA